jgi:hypothetical protein
MGECARIAVSQNNRGTASTVAALIDAKNGTRLLRSTMMITRASLHCSEMCV